MSIDSADSDLEERIDALEESMRSLQAEVRQSADRGRLGFPRAPSARQFLKFTDQAVLPALIAILEVNIKILKTIRRAIRLTHQDDVTDSHRDTFQSLNGEVLNQFDRALAELQSVIEGSPIDETARDILADAKALREDLEHHTEHVNESQEPSSKTPATTAESDPIDVNAELDSIKAEFESNETVADDDPPDENG